MFQLTDKHLKIDTPHTTLLFKVCHKEIQPYYTCLLYTSDAADD